MKLFWNVSVKNIKKIILQMVENLPSNYINPSKNIE